MKRYQQKKWLCLVGIVLLSFQYTAQAQQEVLYSQYMFNTLAINPAYAGNRDVLSISTIGRYQWMGVPGAPTTYSFTMDAPFKNEKMGVGLQAYNDAIGHSKNTGASLSYAYKVKVGEKSTLSLGLQGSITSVNWRLSNVVNGGLDPVFSGANDINRMYPNVGGGIYISNAKSYFSFSVPQIIETKLNQFTTTDAETDIRTRRHYYAMMGFVIGNGPFKVKPSMLLRYTNGSPLGIDGNINFWIRDMFSIGISGRKSQTMLTGQDALDAVVGMVELQLTSQLRLGYAYDVNRTRLNASQTITGTPSHEGLLRYEFGYKKNKILSPRFF